jgi:hypothetical protein
MSTDTMPDNGQPEDKRSAAGITVALSGQLMSASFAALGFAVAGWCYLLDKRECDIAFYLAALGSFLVLSIFVAGQGLTMVRNAGLDRS